MKIPLYAIATVGLGVAGVLSYGKIAEHEEALNKTQDVERDVAEVESHIAAAQKEYTPLKSKKDEVEVPLNEVRAEIENNELELNTLKQAAKELDRKVAAQEETLAEATTVIAEVKAKFEEQGVPVEGATVFMEGLEEEAETLTTELEEVAAAAEEAKVSADTKNQDLLDLKKREVERAKSLKQNGVSSLITAVSNNWGFVIIKPHPSAVIKADSKLIIVRGARHIGRLRINSVEANRVIADIDRDSLVAGSRVRAGDRVILAKTNSH